MTLELPSGNGRPPRPSLAGRLFGGAGKAVGWAARTGYDIAKQVPGVEFAERGLQQVERAAVGELRKRMADAEEDGFPTLSYAQAPVLRGTPVITSHGDVEPLRATLARLLEGSLTQSAAETRRDLYTTVLAAISPDEARIFAALSDGSPYALVDVAERTGLNSTGRYLMRNASDVGKAAGITMDDFVPYYVHHLHALGLVERGDEIPQLHEQYDILQTDSAVRAALDAVKHPKVIRRSLHISPFGAALWQACYPSAWER